MAKVRIQNMIFYAYHGVLEQERQLGQQYEVDVELDADLNGAILTDRLDQTIDYRRVYHLVKNVILEKPYHLIETIAGKIANRILSEIKIQSVIVKVRKPHAPMDGIAGSVEVEIKRP